MPYSMVWNGWISVDIPDNWECDEDLEEQLISIYEPNDGVGSVQISFAQHLTPLSDAQAWVSKTLKAFLEGYGETGLAQLEASGASAWIGHRSFIANGSYWEVWLWSSAYKRVFITYNCAEENLGSEQAVYRAIVASVQWLVE